MELKKIIKQTLKEQVEDLMKNEINDIFIDNLPDGVYRLFLDIKKNESGGRYDYYIEPRYILDRNDEHGLIKVITKSSFSNNFETKGDRVFDVYEKNMEKLIKSYLGVKVYVKGRGVTEKSYWESMQDI
jgi:hypothetical protein